MKISAADIDLDPSRLLKVPDGRVFRDVEVFVSDERYRRQWNGYECPWCFEPLEKAFDRTCRKVDYVLKRGGCWGGTDQKTPDEWHAYMDRTYGGVKWRGPTAEMLD